MKEAEQSSPNKVSIGDLLDSDYIRIKKLRKKRLRKLKKEKLGKEIK